MRCAGESFLEIIMCLAQISTSVVKEKKKKKGWKFVENQSEGFGAHDRGKFIGLHMFRMT